MSLFLVNLLLTFIWAALRADFSAETLATGFIISFLVLAGVSRIWGTHSYGRKSWLLLKFTGFMIWELFVSNFKVSIDVLSPSLKSKPGVIAIPLKATTDLEITLIANLISLTPGTLTLDVSSDKKTIFVHTMFAEDVEEQRATLKRDIEEQVLRILR